jgi:hypothetical protein
MTAGTRTAANGLVGTLHTLYPRRSTRDLWHMVGVTEMIGIDDCSGVPCTSFLWPSMKVSFVLTRRR